MTEAIHLEPTKSDSFPTATSDEQEKTEAMISQCYSADPPKLERSGHLSFLFRLLAQGMPVRYVSQDASQPWILFWIMQSFSLLGAGLDLPTKQRIIDTVMSFQHPEGGFGGGPHQFPHLLTTYAAVCTLAIVGRAGPGGGWDQIDREKLYRFFMSLKQPDGSFLVATDMEVDVRGTYCLLVVATLLDILTPELVENTAGFIASCQTYEGGFSSASQPYYSPTGEILPYPRPPLGEAHGGYTSCAIASWILLKQADFLDDCDVEINIPRLLRWLVHLQGLPIEMGGFRGRTNKLVDGCYSWWVGGSFNLLEALGTPSHHPGRSGTPEGETEEEWEDCEDALFDKTALQNYILLVAQTDAGLRDKPKKAPDAYHTLYNLAGLASSQHRMQPQAALRSKLEAEWKESKPTLDVGGETDLELQSKRRKRIWASSLSWIEDEATSSYVGGKSNRVNASHPLFNLTATHAKNFMKHFYSQ